MIGWLLTHGPARKALGLILTVAAILLFLMNLHAAPVNAPGARPNALTPKRETMPSTARCSTPPPAALLIAMLLLTGCAMGGS